MKLKLIYDSKESVPSEYAALYTEKDGKWHLTEIENLPSGESIARLEESLRKEREDHKTTKGKLRAFGDADPTKIHEELDELNELRELRDAGKLGSDEEKLAKLADARVARETAPLKRELEKVTRERDEAVANGTQTQEQLKALRIRNAINGAATEAKLLPSAIEDALMLAERVFDVDESGKVLVRDEVGFVPGMPPTEWLAEMKDKRPHWWPNSEGGGARTPGGGGGDANNPWTADNWNMTEQMRIVTSDRAKADRLAKAAGSSIGAIAPTKKSA